MRMILAVCVLSAMCCSCSETAEPPPSATKPDGSGLPELVAAVERRPEDAAARRALAIALHGARRRHEAVAQFEKLVEIDPRRRHLLDLALAYKSISRIPESVAVYERILALSPDDPVVLFNLGNISLTRGDDEDALDLYRRAIAARPDYILAHYYAGQALTRLERFAEAYRTYESVLALEPKDGTEMAAQDDALYRLASLDLAMGAYERAAVYLTEVTEASPDHPNAHHALGQALMHLGRQAEATAQFEEHVRILSMQDPTGPVASGD